MATDSGSILDEALNVVAKRFLHSKQAVWRGVVCWLRGMAAGLRGCPWDYVNRLMNAFGSPNCIGNGSIVLWDEILLTRRLPAP